MRLLPFLLLLAACGRDPINGTDGPGLQPPAGTPTFDNSANDLSGTWLGFPTTGGATYDTVSTTTDPAGDRLDGADVRERRTYSQRDALATADAWVEITGDRFLDEYSQRVHLSTEGWVYREDDRTGDWVPVWPAEVEEGDTWTGPITWFQTFDLRFEGQWEVLSLNGTSANGFTGVHVRSTFEAEGYTGTWEAWHTSDGPRAETCIIIDPSGIREAGEALWRPL
jgi:hypothetical protein